MNDRFRFRMPITNKYGKFEKFVYFDLFNQPAITCRESDIFENPEQCTGLHDKNGRLIYEGDIIKEIPKELCIASYFYDEYTYKVVFWYGRFGYTALDVNYAEQGDTFDFEFAKYDYEVIGNIHENPELLEDK